MKRLLWLLLLGSAFAQTNTFVALQHFQGAPTNPCVATFLAQNDLTDDFYTCDVNALNWVQIGATQQFGTAGLGSFWGPGIISNPFSMIAGGLAQSAQITDTANAVYVVQFVLQNSWTIRKVSATCSNNQALQTATFGIYSSSGNKLVDGGKFNYATAPAVQTNTITPVTIPPGTYWFAQAGIQVSGATFTGFQPGTDATKAEAAFIANATRMGRATNTLSSGNLPATLGTITSVNFSTLTPAVGVATPLFEP